MKPGSSSRLLVAIVLLLLVAAPAEAYIDPGTGSLALQAMIGAIAAVAFALRSQWAKIVARLRRPRPQPQDPGAASTER